MNRRSFIKGGIASFVVTETLPSIDKELKSDYATDIDGQRVVINNDTDNETLSHIEQLRKECIDLYIDIKGPDNDSAKIEKYKQYINDKDLDFLALEKCLLHDMIDMEREKSEYNSILEFK